MNVYLVDITIRVKADDDKGAWYLANDRATRAFDEALVHISEPEIEQAKPLIEVD
jgi:hypothetical protein